MSERTNLAAAGYARRAMQAARQHKEARKCVRERIAPDSQEVLALRYQWHRFVVSGGNTLCRLKALGSALEDFRRGVRFLDDDWPAWVDARRAAGDLPAHLTPDEVIVAAAHLRESHYPEVNHGASGDASGSALMAGVAIFVSEIVGAYRAHSVGAQVFRRDRTFDEIVAAARDQLEHKGKSPDSLGGLPFHEVVQLARAARTRRWYDKKYGKNRNRKSGDP